jgi:putative Ig domain-containing protein
LVAVNPITGVISHADGITIELSGGYVSSGVTAEVFNLVAGGTSTGILTLNLPGGLSIASGDTILINGVQVDVTGKSVGDSINCLITAFPASSHLFNTSSAVVGHVVDNALRITTASLLPDGLIGTGYTHTLMASNGSPPYTWHLTAGSLPTSTSLNCLSGVLSGGPATGGTFNFTIEARDSLGKKVSKNFTLNVQGIQLDRSVLNIGEAAVGTSLTRAIIVSNVGTTAQDVVVSYIGPAAFRVSPTTLKLEAGKSEAVQVTFTPPDANNGFLFLGQLVVIIPGASRGVSLSGQGRIFELPVASLLSSSGPTVGNTRVRVRTNLDSLVGISLGGVPLSNFTRTGTDEWAGITGAHAAGAVDLALTLGNGAVVTIPNGYTYRLLEKAAAQPGDLRIRFISDTREFRSNLGINNLAGQPASVRVSLVDNNGLVTAQTTVQVPANGLTQINNVVQLEDSKVTGREGYLLLSSNQPIRAWASLVDTTSLDPSLQLASNEASNRLLVPSSVANERFSTAMVVINASATDGTVNLILRTRSGSVQAVLNNLNLPAFGYLLFEDFYRSQGLDSGSGPIEIEAHGAIQVTALARIYSRDQTGGFLNAVPLASARREIIVPNSIDTAQFRTNLGLNNPGPVAASVSISLVGRDGLALGMLNDIVPAGALVQWNDINRSLLGSSSQSNQEGSLRIHSDQDVIAWVSQINNVSQDPDFFVAGSAQATRLLIPSAVSVGRYHSTLILVNPDAAPESVTLTARSTDGTVRHTAVVTISGNGWVAYEDVLDSLGLAGTYGPLEVSSMSNKSILAVSRVVHDGRTSGLFEAVPLPVVP